MTPPDLSVIIVSWNVRELLRACLAAVFATPGVTLDVIVVDNASTDGSVAMVQAEFPAARMIANAENRGFPGGNNQGLALSTGRYVMLLNPDTVVEGDALAVLVAYLDAHPRVGAAGPQLLYPDGTVQSSRRRFPTAVTAFFESTWLQPYAPRAVLERYYVRDHGDDETCAVDWVVGAALIVRRAAYEQAGGLDEGFFMYSEELDWCRRIKAAGWEITYLPAARIVHYEGQSSAQVAARRHIYFQTSKLRYFRKYHGRATAAWLRGFLLFSYACQYVIELLKFLLGHKRDLRRQRLAAYAEVLRSRLAARSTLP